MASTGVVALKTPACAVAASRASPAAVGVPHLPTGCPICDAPGAAMFAALADKAPQPSRSVSALRDPLTGEPLDERNGAVVLPNGRVYGAGTVALLTSEDGSKVVCGKTGAVFPAGEVRRAFVV